KVRRWARLQLPNGQKVQSLWCGRETKANACKSHNVKLTIDENVYLGLVCFLFQLQLHENMEPVSLTLISAYSPPNYNNLIDSSGSLF
ncbi:hypothetical protein PAXRUDRAFT_80664, partial [Paxillus rubicundulus Ve08.2h10]